MGAFHSTKYSGFEISKVPRAHWNGAFRLQRPDPSHRTFGYCSCKQEAKERYWTHQFRQMESDILVRLTEISEPSKVIPNIPVGKNRNGPFHLISNRNFRNFGLNGKRPIFPRITAILTLCKLTLIIFT